MKPSFVDRNIVYPGTAGTRHYHIMSAYSAYMILASVPLVWVARCQQRHSKSDTQYWSPTTRYKIHLLLYCTGVLSMLQNMNRGDAALKGVQPKTKMTVSWISPLTHYITS